MNPITFVYTEILFRPLFNLLVGITNVLPVQSVGLSILIVTVLVRLILLPPSFHQAKNMQHNQEKMKAVRKDIKKINEKYKDDRAKKSEATMKLYKEAGINPASGCLPLLIQLPILIALYRVFLVGLNEESFSSLYSFVSIPAQLQIIFFGINVTEPSTLLAVVAGILQFVLMRLVTAATPAATGGDDQTAKMMASMQKNMMYIFPVMTVFISIQLPAALALYWVASTIFAIVQQYIFKRYLGVSSATPV